MIGTLTDDLVWSYTFSTAYKLRVTIESGPERGLPPRLTITVLSEFEAERLDDEDAPDDYSPDLVVALSTEGYAFNETIPPWWFSRKRILDMQMEVMRDADPGWQLPEECPEYERWADVDDAISAVFEGFCRHTLEALCRNSQKCLLETPMYVEDTLSVHHTSTRSSHHDHTRTAGSTYRPT